ncbi:MAG: adenylate/guanylate cyclase domain-containing protein [Actinomycetota bacterium]
MTDATIVFTDLVGFTAYTDACGDAAALALLDQQTHLARGVVDAADGRVVKELGDGLMLWFAAPRPAVEATIELRAQIERARGNGTFELAVRYGMHHGEVQTRADDYVGRTVNIAARVTDLAAPGELLVSDHVLGGIGSPLPAVTFRDVGPTRIRGVAAPIWLYRLAD